LCRWQLNQGALSISECNFWVEADCYIFFNNNVYVCFIFNIVVIMLFGKNMFICDWKITVIWAFEHFMFAVQFVSNDNYTVINFIFGSIFSKIFLVYNSGRKSDWIWWEFQYFDLNSDWFGQNQNLSTNILNVNRSKLQPSDRNQSKFWISDRFGSKYHRSKTPRMVFKNFEAWFWRSKLVKKLFWPILSVKISIEVFLTDCQSVEIISCKLWPIGQDDISTNVFPTDHFRSKYQWKSANSLKIFGISSKNFGQNRPLIL